MLALILIYLLAMVVKNKNIKVAPHNHSIYYRIREFGLLKLNELHQY